MVGPVAHVQPVGWTSAAVVDSGFDRLLVDYVTELLLAVAEHLDQAQADILAFTTFPKGVWPQVWFTHSAEGLIWEVWRSTDAVGIFLNRAALVRVVGPFWPSRPTSGLRG